MIGSQAMMQGLGEGGTVQGLCSFLVSFQFHQCPEILLGGGKANEGQ